MALASGVKLKPGEERGESFLSCLGPDRTASGTAPRRGARAQVAGLATAPTVPSQNEAGRRARSVPYASALGGDRAGDEHLGLPELGVRWEGWESYRGSMWRLPGLVGQTAQRTCFLERPSCQELFTIYIAGRMLLRI